MKRRTPAVAAVIFVAAVVTSVALIPAACQAQTPKVTRLSRPSAKVGARLTIRGSCFGSSQGASTVTFGERPNMLGFAPCSKAGRVISWSSTSITVRVPGLAPGSHKVYVTAGGSVSNAAAFSISPLRTISNRTFATSSDRGYWVPSVHDVLYDRCTFTATNRNIAGIAYGVVTLGCGRTVQRVTFHNCVFKGNTGSGTGGGDGGVNGVKVNNWWGAGETVDDISFVNCTFGRFSRMAYEQVNDTAAHAARRVAFIGCSFEPCGAEAISNNDGDLYELISNCTFKGSAEPTIYAGGYGGTVECSGSYLEMRNSHFWACNGGTLNIQDPQGAEGVNHHILIKNTDFDYTHTYQPTFGSGVFVFGMHHISYVRLAGCTINTGSRKHCCYAAGGGDGLGKSWAPWGWYYCGHIDFSGSTITGYITMGGSPHMPATAKGYWSPDADPTHTCIWPTLARGAAGADVRTSLSRSMRGPM